MSKSGLVLLGFAALSLLAGNAHVAGGFLLACVILEAW
jgi:hypothetical protein